MSEAYHILSLSGGKDSTALAFFIKDKMPEVHEKIEYIFCDTEKEILETYDYLNKIEVFLGKPITRLKPLFSFDHLYQVHRILPSVNRRWCTVELKTKVFKKHMYDRFKKEGEKQVILYIGIRADESERASENMSKDNYIVETHPFIEHGIKKQDVTDILTQSGIGFPDYYRWRKRSGCYFCFYQSKMDWINLYENHPELYEKAMAYEFDDKAQGKSGRFGWNVDMSLKEMIKPENIKKIRENAEKLREKRALKPVGAEKLIDLFDDDFDCEDTNRCVFCHG